MNNCEYCKKGLPLIRWWHYSYRLFRLRRLAKCTANMYGLTWWEFRDEVILAELKYGYEQTGDV